MDPTRPDPPYVSPKGMWVTKLIFRIFQFLFNITVFGLVGTMISAQVWEELVLVCIGPVCGASAAWALAEGIAIIVRGGHRGIHPGANVAVDLLLWLGFAPAIAISSFITLASTVSSSVTRASSRSALAQSASFGLAVVILGAILNISHFVTFVLACVETSRRNSQTSQPRIIYVNNYVGQPQYPPPGPYNSPFPQAPYQSYQAQYDAPQPPPQTYQQGAYQQGAYQQGTYEQGTYQQGTYQQENVKA